MPGYKELIHAGFGRFTPEQLNIVAKTIKSIKDYLE